MRSLCVSLGEGLRDVAKNPQRSVITALATMLAAASIVFTSSLVEGSVQEFREFLDRLGGVETFHVNNSGRLTTRQERRELSVGLTMADAAAMELTVPRLRAVAPIMSHWPAADFESSGRRYRYNIIGTTPSFPEATTRQVQAGRFFTDLEVARASRVVVLGPVAANALGINAEDFEERQIRLGGFVFTVVVVLKPQASWLDRLFVMPITTVISIFYPARIEGGDFEPERLRLDQITVRLHRASDLDGVIEATRRLLLVRHNGVEDFGFDTRENWSEGVEEQVRASESMGMFVVVVSLAVATISLANVLLASLRQRIREMGIRLSVGCRPWQISVQVLAESVVLCAVGSLAGVFLGGWLEDVVGGASPAVLAPVDVSRKMFAFSVVAASGLLAGLVPAVRCARLRPVEALSADV